MRDRAWNRKTSIKKARRKKRITEEVYWHGKDYPWYNNLHQYSKNKIHCSCPLCRGESSRTKKEEILTRELLKDELDF